MADTLEIFGVEYTNVAGIIAKDDNGVDQTYTKGGGHLTQDQDGFLVIPPDGSGGGGGSSDFSTAQVTVVNNGVTPVDIYMPLIVTDAEEDVRATTSLLVGHHETIQINAILYKGMADLYFPDGDSGVVITGNAEKIDTAFYYITGDCTITIS